jgi:hypothetical protein
MIYFKEGGRRGTYPADDVVVVGKMGFAVLAAVYFIGVEIDIVCQPHFGGQLW